MPPSLTSFHEKRSPHMRRLYGKAIRKESGVSKTLRNVARTNATKAPPEVQRKLKKFSGSLEKIYDDATEAIESFIGKCLSLTLFCCAQ